MNGTRDITAVVRAALPAPLAAKLAQSEGVLGHPVTFLEDRNIPGAAGGSVSPDGVVRVSPQHARDLAVIGEEVLHLYRWTSGFPAITPMARAQRFASGLKQIGGHFDEFAFFGVLEEINLDPRALVTAAMPETARLLRAALQDIEAEGATPYWRVVLSAIFAQASLFSANTAGRTAVLAVFDEPQLAQYRATGLLLCGELASAQSEDSAAVATRMRRCLFEHLGLTGDDVSVGPVY